MSKFNLLHKLVTSVFTISLFFVVGCDKEITETTLPKLNPSVLDENGGNWKPVLVTSPSSIQVLEPSTTTSSEYIAELEALKSARTKLSSQQKNAISYWSGGGILRWNEIIRELVAKYNIPAVNNPDGTYPIPDATKPTSYPEFPFANPPYAARAYALLSVAQYDALVTTWYYKFQFNRPAPYNVDNSIEPSFNKSALPSYPSESAVIASTSLELMKFLFPGEVEYLTKKADEHKLSGFWAGVNVMSDIAAGDSIGKAVAKKIIDYAKNDGMKSAGKWSPELAEECKLKAEANFGKGWSSFESPARPPMLPFYGNVKTWLFDESTKIALRPPAPPSVNSDEFKKALSELKDISKSLTREQFKIVSYWADGIGTYTPPGHWNTIAADLIVKNKMSELKASRTFALLNMAMMDAGICCWDTKFLYFFPRPSAVDNSIKTATGLPNFPAYTSGHSTFSGAASAVLSHVFPSETEKLNKMAEEASVSRLYGGIHYRFDCEIGLKCGKDIGAYAIQRAQTDGASD